jgi:hypothetical protein
MTEIKEELVSVVRQLGATEGSPELLQRLRSLEAAYHGLEAAQQGMPRQVKVWQEFMEEIKDEVAKRLRTLTDQEVAVGALNSQLRRSASAAAQGTAHGPAAPTSAGPPQVAHKPEALLDFKKPWVGRHADQLLLDGNPRLAEKKYRELFDTYKAFGLEDEGAGKELAIRIEYARRVRLGAHEIAAAQAGPAANTGIAREITPEQVAAVEEASATPGGAFELQKMKQGASEPYWVLERTGQGSSAQLRPAFVFKPDDPRFPLGGEAECVMPNFAHALGLKAAAAAHCKLTINGKDVKGTLIRVIEGTVLMNEKLGRQIALKKKLARYVLLRAFVGDRDGHGLNYRVGGDGDPVGYDWNLADFLEKNDAVLMKATGLDELSPDPARAAQQTEQLMEWRLRFMYTNQRELYQCMVPILNQITYKDIADDIQTMQGWTRKFFRKCVGNRFGDNTERVLDILEMRRDCLEPVFWDFLEKTPGVSLHRLPRGPRWWDRLKSIDLLYIDHAAA